MYTVSKEQQDLAQHFICYLKAVDPHFEMPFDEMAWANQIKIIEETGGYSVSEIKLAIDWLFSNSGKWFQKNVPDAYHLRKHIKTIMKQMKPFEDTEGSLILQIQSLEKRLDALRKTKLQKNSPDPIKMTAKEFLDSFDQTVFVQNLDEKGKQRTDNFSVVVYDRIRFMSNGILTEDNLKELSAIAKIKDEEENQNATGY